MPVVAKLQKVQDKKHSNPTKGTLERDDGSFTESKEEAVKVLLQTYFPYSCISQVEIIFNPSRVMWALDSLKPFKSPGVDGIFPTLLQHM